MIECDQFPRNILVNIVIFLCKTKLVKKKMPPICRTMKTSPLLLTVLKKNFIFKGILASNIIFSHIMNIPFAIH